VSTAAQTFGSNVRAARAARQWTQEDLAHATGLTSVQISRVERGVREVRLTTIIRLAEALDATPDDLMRGLV
jgi:transcriptional regulator with XRE-family HTH domain